MILRLLLAQARGHAGRTLITVLAIAVAVVVVGLSVRGVQVTRREMVEASRQFGRYDAILSPRDFGTAQLDPALIAALRADPAVKELDAAVRTRIRVLKPDPMPVAAGAPGGQAGMRGGPGGAPAGATRPAPMGGPFGGSSAMGTSATVPPQRLGDGRWLEPRPGLRETVVSTNFQTRYGLRLGDQVVIAGNGSEQVLTVVGTVAVKPMVPGVRMMPAAHLADLWVSQETAAELNGYADRPSLLAIVLTDPEAAAAFGKAWRDKALAGNPPARLRTTQDEPEDPMGGPPSGMRQLLFATTTVGSILAAGFIAFLSLSIGMRARLRQYAILRALALTRGQLGALVLGEAVAFAVSGLAAGLLLLVGTMALCRALAGQVPAFASAVFAAEPLGGTLVAVCAITALAGVLLAAIIPVWQAIRIRPIDVLGGQGSGRPGSWPRWATVLGAVCIVANPLLILLGHHEGIRALLGHLQGGRGFGAPLAGSLLMIIGLALVTPFVVRLCERLLHPPTALLLGLNPGFLRQQLSGNLWRAVGTTVALSTGLTLFVAALVWGHSMLRPFTPTDGLPRMQVAILPAGLPDEALAEFLALPGIEPARCLPMAVEQPRLSAETLARPGFLHVDDQQRHVLVMGIDPQRAFAGADPLFHLDFVAGDPVAAAAAMAAGRGCVIPDHFATQCGLKPGDTFTVEVPEGAGPEVTYTVAGIAEIPGWNWLTKFSEARRRAGRALAIVFADHAQVRKDYALERIGYFWLDPVGLGEAPEAGRILAERIEPLAKRHARVNLNVPRAGRTAVGTQYVNVTDREEVKARLLKRAGDVISGLQWMPLVTLAITSLAVFNTILASIRARYWQFGVLRGIGMTRGQLARLILGESLLLWLVASILSLAAGTALAWCGTRLSTLFFFFAGRTPPLVLPWGQLALGFLLAFALCLLAGLIPALAAGRKEPLRFIQGGRLST